MGDVKVLKAGEDQSPSWRSAFYAALIFGMAGLGFTALGILLGSPDVQVGGVRPEDTIAPHLAALAGFGLVLGLGSMLIYGRKGLPLVFLAPTLTVLLDIDHLPVYLGYAEPIRPAHSLVFLVFVLGVTGITIKALEIELVMASSFLGHMAVDTGLFAPWSPFTFDYVQLDQYRVVLAAGALICAIAAGVVLRLRQRAGEGGVQRG
jgi:hypothetical protein